MNNPKDIRITTFYQLYQKTPSCQKPYQEEATKTCGYYQQYKEKKAGMKSNVKGLKPAAHLKKNIGIKTIIISLQYWTEQRKSCRRKKKKTKHGKWLNEE